MLQIFQVLDLGLGMFRLVRLESGNPSKHKSIRSCYQEVSVAAILRSHFLWRVIKTAVEERDTAHGVSADLSSFESFCFSWFRLYFSIFRTFSIQWLLLVPLLFGFRSWRENKCSVGYQYSGMLLLQSRILGAEGVSVSSCQLHLTQRAGTLLALCSSLFCPNLNALFSLRGM